MSAVIKSDVVSSAPVISHVDWPAIFAGAVLASAIGFVLMTFGSGLGLSLLNPVGKEGASPVLIASMIGLWTAWVVISSFAAGGYLAGRMRRRAVDISKHEVEIRDGSHGLTVWALGILIGGFLAATGVANLTGAVASASTSAISAGVEAVSESDSDPVAMMTDRLLRSDSSAAQSAADASDVRGEIARLVSSSVAAGEITTADQEYLATLVERIAGIDADEAEARVSTAISNAEEAAAMALDAAEAARKSGILMSFLLAAVLVISAAAAWWASTMGGRHRDEGIEFNHLTRWK